MKQMNISNLPIINVPYGHVPPVETTEHAYWVVFPCDSGDWTHHNLKSLWQPIAIATNLITYRSMHNLL